MSDRTHDDPEAAGTAALFYEAGVLRRVPRTGWGYDGIPGGETVAEHSHRAAVIGAALAAVEGADPGRTALLCVLHDLHEARTGDLTPLAKRYVAFKADPRDVTADQTAGAHPAVRDVLASAVDEFESADSAEARCAHDADKLDCIIAALEYRAQGHTAVQGKINRCLAALKTASARRIAEAALTTAPTSWQQLFAAAATTRAWARGGCERADAGGGPHE